MAAGVPAAEAPVAASELDPPGVAWQSLGSGVFRRRHVLLDQNVGLVLGADAALLIDTRPTPAGTRELLDDLGDLTALPLRFVVDTHFHFDHTFGNECFPRAMIWGHRRCARALRVQGEAQRAAALTWMPDEAAALAAVRITPPGHLVDTSVALDLGGRSVELHYLGRGHTDGDLVVLVPDAGVVFAGDLLEEGAPPSFEDSFPLDWPACVGRLLDLAGGTADRRRIVPGHGDLVDRGSAESQWRLLEAVAAAAVEGHAAHVPPEIAAAGVALPAEVGAAAIRRAYAQLDAAAGQSRRCSDTGVQAHARR